MLTVSKEDINSETNFMIDKPLRIHQTLYIYANYLQSIEQEVPFIMNVIAFVSSYSRTKFSPLPWKLH